MVLTPDKARVGRERELDKRWVVRRMPPLVPTSASTTEHLARPPDLGGAWCTRQIHHATKTNTIYNRYNNNLNTNAIGREINISKVASLRD